MVVASAEPRATDGAPAGDPARPLVVGLGGTTRQGSSSERALRFCLTAAERAGARTEMLGATDIDLPMYAPERPDRTPAARRLVELLASADGIVVATPGYHGGLSGLVKNALDYVEDLRDADPPYLDGRPVGTIVCAAGWQATTTTLVSLRSIIHALRGWPTPLGVAINSAQRVFADDGGLLDPQVAEQLELMGGQVVELARLRRR